MSGFLKPLLMRKRSALSLAVILSITLIPVPANAGPEKPGDLQEKYFNPTDLRHVDLKLDGIWKTSLGFNLSFQDDVP